MREAIALAFALTACGARAESSACPSGTHEDASRTQAIIDRLDTSPDGHALLARRSLVARVCFAPASSASVLTTDHVILLADDLELGEAAARVGHLLVHLRDGLPIDAVSGQAAERACDAAVDRALTLEARAYVVEVELQGTLDAHPHVLAFEFTDAVRAAPADARDALVLAYLRTHPSGGPGIEGLGTAYRAQCAH
jgi:hypothetical protein